MRIGLFGGTFDPIHVGHLIYAQRMAEAFHLDKVIFIPANIPPHKTDRQVSLPRHRMDMIGAAITFPGSIFECSDIELKREGVSYTFDTVSHFWANGERGSSYFLMVGHDTMSQIPKWHRYRELNRIIRIIWSYTTVEMPDCTAWSNFFLDEEIKQLKEDSCHIPEIAIRSTDIRNRIRSGKSVRYMVPDDVMSCIDAFQLYR